MYLGICRQKLNRSYSTGNSLCLTTKRKFPGEVLTQVILHQSCENTQPIMSRPHGIPENLANRMDTLTLSTLSTLSQRDDIVATCLKGSSHKNETCYDRHVSRVFESRACNFSAIQFDTQLLAPNMSDASPRCLHQNFTSTWSLLKFKKSKSFSQTAVQQTEGHKPAKSHQMFSKLQ